MSFVAEGRDNGRSGLGTVRYRDPLQKRRLRTSRGLGSGASTTTDISTGAGIGTSVEPGLGTVIGAAVGAIASLFSGGKDKTGLPQVPSTNAAFNSALATKWYTLYFTRYAPGGADANPATQVSGITYWAKQIAEDGPQRAWANFSTSPQPVADGVPAIAVAYTPQYGNQYVLAPANAPPIGDFVPAQVTGAPTAPSSIAPPAASASLTPAQVAALPAQPAQASILGGLSTSTALLLGGGLLVGLILMNRRTAAPPTSTPQGE